MGELRPIHIDPHPGGRSALAATPTSAQTTGWGWPQFALPLACVCVCGGGGGGGGPLIRHANAARSEARSPAEIDWRPAQLAGAATG